jgi:hypothetical protein
MTDRAGPSVSVVVAAPQGAVEPEEARLGFLAQLEPSRGDELIWERGESQSVLVPELWARGILKSRGQIIALTLSSMVPDSNWAAVVRRSLGEAVAGVGGAIEPAAAMRPLDWGIHLARYSGYLLPFPARDVDDLPGDNAAYRRETIEACRPLWADGFWETAIDRELRRRGERLRVTPDLVVRQGPSVGFFAFCRNRFLHGRYHGREQGRGGGPANRWLRVVASPAVPAILLARIARRAISRGRARGLFVGLPYLLVFLAAWAAGEAVGYLRGHG